MTEQFAIEFTLPYYDGKWVGLSGDQKVFDSIELARDRCKRMGPVYFTCGEQQVKWMQRILDVDTGEVLEYVHDFTDIESVVESD